MEYDNDESVHKAVKELDKSNVFGSGMNNVEVSTPRYNREPLQRRPKASSMSRSKSRRSDRSRGNRDRRGSSSGSPRGRRPRSSRSSRSGSSGGRT